MKTGNLNGQGLAELQNYKIQNLASAPTTNLSKGRFYFNTTDNTLYVYDGTNWVDALTQGATYTEGGGIDITNLVISLDLATGANAGNVTLTTTNGLAANAPTASTSTAGLIEIATDTEASTGTDTSRAVTPKQLATKVTGNTAITSATKTKITYDSKGLVTSGADLEASDIPNLTLSKITDVTASASELNIMDGVTVTTSDINSVTSKIGLTNLSIDSGSSNYLGYDNATGKFSAKVDTTVTGSSSKLITSGAVDTAIKNAITNVYKAQGTVAFASLPTLSSSIEGYVYNVSDAFTTTSDFVEGSGKSYPAGTNVVCINTSGTTYKWDVLAGSIDTSSFITASSTNTLTNKSIDADDNTISDLTTSNLKSGVLQTTVRDSSSASDTAIPSEKAVRSAIGSAIAARSYWTDNPALTSSGGVCTWTVNHGLASSALLVDVFELSTGEKVMFDVAVPINSSTITVSILSESNIAANTYRVVVQR